MPNHVHLIAVPQSIEGLARAIGEAHRRYTRRGNFREGWRGHLWQGRFASRVLNEAHLIAAARDVDLNPVRARLVRAAGEYLWSSAAVHITRQNDDLVKVGPLLGMVEDWSAFLAVETVTERVELLRLHERTGRPLGTDEFIGHLEKTIGRRLRRKMPGPKRTIEGNQVWCTRNSGCGKSTCLQLSPWPGTTELCSGEADQILIDGGIWGKVRSRRG